MLQKTISNIYITIDTYMFHMLHKNSAWLVFSEFLERPEEKHQIRRISKNIDLATTSVKKHIDELKRQGFVSEGKDIFKYYKAESDNEKFKFYKKINSLDKIENSGLLKYIEDETGCEVIYLFGSTAKGEDTSKSDLDIYVQAPESDLNLQKYEEELGKKIQLFFSEDINALPLELRNNILNGIKLRGYLKVF